MKHLITVTWQHIRRSPYQALSAIMIMTMTTFAILAFTLLSISSQKLLTYLERKPQVIAFFNDTVTTKDQIAPLVEVLEKTGKAASIKFVSKEEALQIYRERNKNDPLLLELVTANTLPASVEVSAANVSDLPSLYDVLKTVPNVEEISYQKDVVDSLIGALDRVRKFGAGLITFLVATSILTILTIIGMKISVRKDEIDIQRLVGASTWYIRLPFILEGLFYGLASATISWFVITGIIYFSTPHLRPYLSGLSILPVSLVTSLEILGFSLLTGALVGATGSYFAVRRYLKN